MNMNELAEKVLEEINPKRGRKKEPTVDEKVLIHRALKAVAEEQEAIEKDLRNKPKLPSKKESAEEKEKQLISGAVALVRTWNDSAPTVDELSEMAKETRIIK